jgi:hypothetical protein
MLTYARQAVAHAYAAGDKAAIALVNQVPLLRLYSGSIKALLRLS